MDESDPDKRLRSFSRSATPQYFPNSVKDQIRLMAEVSFIHGEVLIDNLNILVYEYCDLFCKNVFPFYVSLKIIYLQFLNFQKKNV